MPEGATIERIALVMAMRAEARPVIAALGLQPAAAPAAGLPVELYRARRGAGEVTLWLNGIDPSTGVDCIATQPAALTSWLAVTQARPDLLISAGTAGAFAAHGAALGDVYLARDAFRYHDRRIALPRFDAYGLGAYPALDMSAVAAALGLKLGIVSSGNALDYTETDLAVMRSYGAELKEMEAAAVAWIATLHGVPVTAVKAVTDLVDHPESIEAQFLANLAAATERLAHALVGVIDYCLGRRVDALGA